MAEQVKKRKSFTFFAKRQVSTNIPLEDEATLEVSGMTANPRSQAPVVLRAKRPSNMGIQKRGSFGAIEDLVQCPLCLEKLNIPKMLPCQHTFCLQCLQTQVIDNLLTCPSCHSKYPANTPKYLEMLPSNLYIDNLLKLLKAPSNQGDRQSTMSMLNRASMIQQMRCSKCQTALEPSEGLCCNHCKQTYCSICWSAHISELKSQISSLLKQLESGSKKLNLRLGDYKDRYEWLVNKINSAIDKKIEDMHILKKSLLEEAADILENGEVSANTLQKQLKETQKSVNDCVANNFDTISDDNDKVNMFMNFHRMTVDILNEVAHWGEHKFSFDQENFKIEEDENIADEAEADDPVTVEVRGIQNPLETPDSLMLYYRSRSFSPRMVYKKCPRPAGVGVAPWGGQENIYICTMDSHHILVLDKNKGKVIQRITDSNLVCPHSIAFSLTRSEFYVTDKWNHCVHIMSKEGTYIRNIGSKGNKDGCFRSPEGIAIDPTENFLYVCDTGNDRVQMFSIDTGAFIRYVGIVSRSQSASSTVLYTQLNAPTGIAALLDRIVVVDSGNRKIKIFSLDGEKKHEFGSFGSHKGQFRHPEVVSVDPLGFILVGDSGNARIQIFKPNGTLVRVFGGKGHFGWVSGLHITPQLEIIVSDPRNHQVSIF